MNSSSDKCFRRLEQTVAKCFIIVPIMIAVTTGCQTPTESLSYTYSPVPPPTAPHHAFLCGWVDLESPVPLTMSVVVTEKKGNRTVRNMILPVERDGLFYAVPVDGLSEYELRAIRFYRDGNYLTDYAPFIYSINSRTDSVPTRLLCFGEIQITIHDDGKADARAVLQPAFSKNKRFAALMSRSRFSAWRPYYEERCLEEKRREESQN